MATRRAKKTHALIHPDPERTLNDQSDDPVFEIDWSKMPEAVQKQFVDEVFRMVRAKMPDIADLDRRLKRIENSVSLQPEPRRDPDTESDFKKGAKPKTEE